MTTSQPEWRSVDNSECISCDRRAGTPGRMDLGVRKFKCSTHASPGMDRTGSLANHGAYCATKWAGVDLTRRRFPLQQELRDCARLHAAHGFEFPGSLTKEQFTVRVQNRQCGHPLV